MLHKFLYFAYSDDRYFMELSEGQRELFVLNKINFNKFVLKICFGLSSFIVLLSCVLEGVIG